MSVWAGFALAPILYIIALAGIAGSILFTGYTQILRSNVEITADNAVRNQIRMASEVISSRSLLNSATLTLDPPAVVAWNTLEAARLPKNAAGGAPAQDTDVQGGAESVGGLPTDGGVRALDPWGRYYIMCRWVASQNDRDDPSIAIISAGPDGKLATDCATAMTNLPASGSDDKVELLSVASVLARSATWQAQGGGAYSFGTDPSAAHVSVGVPLAEIDASKSLDVKGDGRIQGDFTVGGAADLNGVEASDVTANNVATGALSASGDATVGGAAAITGATTLGGILTVTGAATLHDTLNVDGLTTLADLGAGAATLASLHTTGNADVDGDSNVDGMLTAGATTVASLHSIGNADVDGASNVDGLLTVHGDLHGYAGADIDGDANVDGDLTVGGTITGAFGGTVGGGNVSGDIGGNAENVNGVVAILHGGTGATDAATARANLDAQQHDADLDALAAASATGFIRRSGAGTVDVGPILQGEVPAFSGASAGSAGTLGGVPIPAAGQQNFVLRGDSTWLDPASLSVGSIGADDTGIEIVDTETGDIVFTVDGAEVARMNAAGTLVLNRRDAANLGGRALFNDAQGAGDWNIESFGAAGGETLRFSHAGDGLDIVGMALSPAGVLAATGGFSGNLTGNAGTATRLAAARDITLSGDADATGVGFDGSGDITLTTTVDGLQGRAVSSTAPAVGEALVWDGGSWAPAAVSGGGGPTSGDDIDGGVIGDDAGVRILAIDGTAAAPAYSFNADADTGVYRPGNDQLAFATGATPRLVIDASGKVGVGTAAPDEKLTIKDGVLQIQGSVAGGADARVELMRTDTGAAAWFGIPAWDPGALHIFGPTAAGNESAAVYAASTWRFNTGGAERVRIDSAGHVGVGRNAPVDKLEVAGNILSYGASTATYSGFVARNSDTTIDGRLLVDTINSPPKVIVGASTNHALMLITNDASRMYITNTGEVGIGTTSPGAYRLNVNGDTNITGDLTVSGTISGTIAANVISQGDTSVTATDTGSDGAVTIKADNVAKLTANATGITATAPLLGAAGSVSAPSISFAADPNTGLYRIGDGILGVSTGGTERVRVGADGKVGIGATAPQAKLSIGEVSPGSGEPTHHGLIQLSSVADINAGAGGIELKGSSYADGYGWKITAPDRGGAGAGVPLVIASRASNAAWTERMTIDGFTGNVGIGTVSPGAYKLSVNGATYLGGGVTAATPAAQLVFGDYYDNAGPPSPSHIQLYSGYGFGISGGTLNYVTDSVHTFYTGGTGTLTERFRVDTTGATVTGNLSAGQQLALNGKNTIASYDGWLRLNDAGHYGNGIYTPGGLRADGNFEAPIMYDHNNTGYYVDPNGDSRVWFLHVGGLWADDANGGDGKTFGFDSWDNTWNITRRTANTETYEANVLHGDADGNVWTGANLTVGSNNSVYAGQYWTSGGNGSFEVRTRADNTNAWSIYSSAGDLQFWSGMSPGDKMVLDRWGSLYMNSKETINAGDGWLRLNNAGHYGNGIYTPGGLRADGNFEAPIMYDHNNTGYYVDPDGGSNMNYLSLGTVYASNWFRVNAAGTGIYWETYGRGLYMNDATYIRAYNGAERMMLAGYFVPSDARLKHDIRPFERDPIAVMKGLEVVRYKWNKDGSEDWGVIAQAARKVLPEAVAEDGQGFLSVQYDKLVLPVVQAVQNLIARMETAEAKLALLLDWRSAAEKRIAALEAENRALAAAATRRHDELMRRLTALEEGAAANDNDRPRHAKPGKAAHGE